MRKHLYKDLCRILMDIPGVEHVDLWNQDVEFLDESAAFPRPAVFVEFGQIDWEPLSSPTPCWRGSGTVNLHIVTDWNGDAAPDSESMDDNLMGWKLAERIHLAVEGMSGIGYDSLRCVSTITNHNHEDIVDNIEVYRFKAKRTLPKED